MNNNKTFVTAINCMDGRVQKPVYDYLQGKYNADYVDMITEAGPSKVLAEAKDVFLLKALKEKIEISVKKHGSKAVAVIGHFDCAGNPVDKTAQIEDITSAINTLKKWDFDVEYIGLWVGEDWKVSEV